MPVHFHDQTGSSWHVAAVLVLLALLTTLGAFQYRWLGEVSDAERGRMRDMLQTRASDFAAEFDREVTRTYLAFQFETEAFDRDPATAMADAFAAAQASGATRIVRDVYLVTAGAPQTSQSTVLQKLDPAARTLTSVDWPPALDRWRRRVEESAPRVVRAVSPIFLADPVDAAAPALVIPVPKVRRLEGEGRVAVLPDPSGAMRAILVWLDSSAIDSEVVRPLFAKYFGPQDTSAYVVSIVRRDDPAQTVFASSATPDSVAPDVTAGLFGLRWDEANRVAGALGIRVPESGGRASADHVATAVTIVRRAAAADSTRVLMSRGDTQGAWQLRARHRSGPLDAIVAQSRRRNLAIGLGVLVLLGASFVLVVAAAQRQQRLAGQQMEFVAAVSHELRTPLAVICSAGENLADGVVADTLQVKRYGSLIEAEGRRLGETVERVLQFAGISSGTRTQNRTEVDLARVVADAVDAASIDARDRDVTIAVNSKSTLPPTIGDPDALRSAVQNVVGNAVKYSATGGVVDVVADVEGSFATLRVADRGIGIDAADLPHVFKPFFRGRRAVDAQVRGTGVGLSVVRHVVQAHGGDVRVESRAGEGTTVTILLPLQTQPDAAPARQVGHA